jgi:enoyl-CoA hydratase
LEKRPLRRIEGLFGPEKRPIAPKKRPIAPEKRPLSRTRRPLAATTPIFAPKRHLLAAKTRLFGTTGRFSGARGRFLAPISRFFRANGRLLGPSTALLAPKSLVLAPTSRFFRPDRPLLAPTRRVLGAKGHGIVRSIPLLPAETPPLYDPPMPYDTILVHRDGPLVTITLNRPDKLNALNEKLLLELREALLDLDHDAALHCAILTGAGDKAFAAGADIAAMASMTAAEARLFAELGHAVGTRLEQAHFPVIGAINGFALGGGCELALACDFLYASDKAKLGQPEVNLGVMPGFGGTQRLPRRIGVGRARELCYTGDVIDAAEALRLGLVNAVVPHAELLARVGQVASKIASKGPLAVAQCKRAMFRGADVPLPVANELEAQAFAALFGSADQREGMKAFLEKRPAKFEGR